MPEKEVGASLQIRKKREGRLTKIKITNAKVTHINENINVFKSDSGGTEF
jgi:hypothetical protein